MGTILDNLLISTEVSLALHIAMTLNEGTANYFCEPNTDAPSSLHIIYHCFPDTMAELNSCNRASMT